MSMFIKICAKLLLCNGLHKYFAKKMPKYCKKKFISAKKAQLFALFAVFAHNKRFHYDSKSMTI